MVEVEGRSEVANASAACSLRLLCGQFRKSNGNPGNTHYCSSRSKLYRRYLVLVKSLLESIAVEAISSCSSSKVRQRWTSNSEGPDSIRIKNS